MFLGRRQEGNHELAAIKVMLADLAKEAHFVQMFADEAKLLGRLDHKNISKTLEVGHANHMGYIAMEVILGRTLADVWEAARAAEKLLRFDVAAWICMEVARGLHYAHELRGEDGKPFDLIHRDVNPSNIFLGYDGTVKLFDFGLAKTQGKVAQTASGIVKGKVPYLSPEQLVQLTLDRRSDIFSLGTTMWELTTLSRLFKRDNDLDTIRAIRDSEVPDPRVLVDDYPDELWSIVRRALETDRDKRYPTAKELADDLEAFVKNQGTTDLTPFVGALLDHHFPGERQKQVDWLERTAASPVIKNVRTMEPPAPIPSVPSLRIGDISMPLDLVRRKKITAPKPG